MGGQKAAIVTQVGHFYFGAVGQFYIGGDSQGLQCPVQLLDCREHQPGEQRWFRCGRILQSRSCHDSKLQWTRNSPER
jgi:hypothetical protein